MMLSLKTGNSVAKRYTADPVKVNQSWQEEKEKGYSVYRCPLYPTVLLRTS